MGDILDPNNLTQLNALAALKHAETPGVTVLAIAYKEDIPDHGFGEGEDD
jgi:hypothetical protein